MPDRSCALMIEGKYPFKDDDETLGIQEGDTNITCRTYPKRTMYKTDEEWVEHLCATDLGITLCPYTCGYCPPFRYKHLKNFDKPQVTMLPVMIHQTRFAPMDCHGFAHTYEI